MAKLVGRKPVELNINAPQDGYVPLFDGNTRNWTTIYKNDLISGSAVLSGSNLLIGDQSISGSLNVRDNTTLGRNVDSTTNINGILLISGSVTINGQNYNTTSESFASRITTNSSSFSIFSGSYINESSSFASRIITNSASISSLSSSFLVFSGSYNTGSFTGSFVGSLTGTASYATQALTASNANTASSADDFTVRGTLTAQTLVAQTITSSVEFITGSTRNGSLLTNIHQFTGSVGITGSLDINGSNYTTTSGSASTRLTALETFSGVYSTGSFTGSFIGRHTGSFSGSLYNLQNDIIGHIPFYSSSQVLADSIARQIDNGSGSYSIVINQNGVTTSAPEALYVWQPSSTSYNVISGKGNLNSYLQLNIQNLNTGDTASSDVVASANNATETANYVDMGINGENFTPKGNYSVGGANDSYLLSTGRHHYMGSATSGDIKIFTGADFAEDKIKLLLRANNAHELTGSLSITNRLNVIGGVTASLQGTASWANNAITASHAIQALSASYWSGSIINAATASYVLNAVSSSFASTASYVLNAVSASFATLAQTASFVQTAQTASYVLNAVSSSFASTASSVNRLNQNVVVSGSLTVSGSTNIIGNSGTTLLSSNADTLVFTGSLLTSGSIVSTGSLSILGGVTGSLLGTASYATQALSASYWSGSIINAATASYVLNAVSSSYATSALTASNSNTASSADNFTVRGILTAQTINVQTITSSVDFVTGSSINGSLLSNTHQFTGSVSVTGSLTVNNSNVILSNQTSSMSVLSASYAVTSSYIETAQTASYVLQAQSASYALTASNAPDYLPLAGGTLTGDLYASGRTFWYQDLILGYGTTSGKITTDGTKYISIMPDYNVESARFWPNGNVTIQNAGTYVDNGFRLDVSGSGRFTDGLTVTGSLQAISGITGSLLGTASNSVSASYASTASYLNPIKNSYLVLSQVSQSLNFQDDTEAAAGGVPLGGLYRNGNFILIRIV
jgi:hypothetical protein